MHLGKLDFDLIRSPVHSFGQSKVPMDRLITLLVTFENHAQCITIAVYFTVLRMDSSYNVILGRLSLHALRAVSSSLHQCMKFPTTAGICMVRGSQKHVREYYYNSTGEVLISDSEQGTSHTQLETTYLRPNTYLKLTKYSLVLIRYSGNVEVYVDDILV